MTTEFLIIIAIVAIVSAVCGFLAATLKNKSTASKGESELAAAQADAGRLTLENGILKGSEDKLESEVRKAELELQQVKTRVETLEERNAELIDSIEKSKETVEKMRSITHAAENTKQKALSEYKSLKDREADLVARLEVSQEETRSERLTLNIEKKTKAELGEKCKQFEIISQEYEKKCNERKQKIDEYEIKLEEMQERYLSLLAEHTELKTSLSEREEGHAKQLAQFEEQKAALSQQFKVLANEILDAKTKTLQESGTLSMKSIMAPFQQTLDGFKKEVQDIHSRETAQRSELKKELVHLKELNHKITTEAHELSTALRGQKKLQGNWGELVLENVLDRSGLQLGKDYKREVSFNTEEGKQRPDAIVYLPQGKHLIIDAKVSLNAYTRYVNTEDDVERKIALDEHVKAMGDRIKELANRDYYKISELNSPEMVFMFVPIESAFVEALKADETLFLTAIENNVLVATPTTLLTSLNIVRQLWRYEEQNKHTVALAQKAESVFKKMKTFLVSFEKVRKGLESANTAYAQAEGQLVNGSGNLVKQVSEFKKLAPAIKAELPPHFTEKAELEINYISSDQDLEENKEESVTEL